MIIFLYNGYVSQGLGITNLRIWVAEIDIESSLDFPI